MRQLKEPPKPVLQTLLDGVETVGNQVPHPAVIFLVLIGVVVLLLRCAIRRRAPSSGTHRSWTA